jgi:hypothetical protein
MEKYINVTNDQLSKTYKIIHGRCYKVRGKYKSKNEFVCTGIMLFIPTGTEIHIIKKNINLLNTKLCCAIIPSLGLIIDFISTDDFM